MQQLQQMVDELLTTNSSNEKMEILAKYPENKVYLNIIYSDFTQFHVTSANVVKTTGQFHITPFIYNSLMDLLTCLGNGTVTGHDALATIHCFIDRYPEYRNLILSAIDKNLKCRIDTKMINKVFEDLIPTFNVALAKDYNKISKKPNFHKEHYLISRKLDGLRTISIKIGNAVTCYSRTGKEFETLDILKQEILNLNTHEDFVFDGELCLIKDGMEDFQGAMQEIRRKDHTVENPRYKIFDMLTIEEFENGSSDRILSQRLTHLHSTLNNYKGDVLEILPQLPATSEENLMLHLEDANLKGWEGLMVRKDTGYEGKRTNNLLNLRSSLMMNM
jgi:DNA ligase 1